ncbi:MAG: hypothetical protein AB1657_05605 [Candidatus Micrarchaeota archaeon]
MGSPSDPFRNVRFAEPEGRTGNRKPGAGNPRRGLWRRIFGSGEGRADAPIVFGEPSFAEGNGDGRAFLDALPEGEMKKAAFAAVRRRYGERVPSLAEVKEALVEDCDEAECRRRREIVFMFAFRGRRDEFLGRGTLADREAINAFYFGMADFQRIIGVMLRADEEEAVRAKGEDREKALLKIGAMLRLAGLAEGLEALGLVADIVGKMGETLGSKEVCMRMEALRRNMEAMGGGLAALRASAGFIKERGVRPSGKKMDSLVPRAESRRMNVLVGSMPGGVAADAAAIMVRGKPKSCEEFMRMLEEDGGDAEKRRRAVLGAVFPEGIISASEPEIMDDNIARDVAYFCIADILRVTSLADGIKAGRAEIKRDALEMVLRIAKRMPGGARMEAPGLIAGAVEKLVDGGKPKAWIVTAWLEELNAHMLIPDKNAAMNRLAWVCGNPNLLSEYKNK